MSACTNEQLEAHIAKMRTIHGDEPIRIKIALPWAEELLKLRKELEEFRNNYGLIGRREEDDSE